MKTFLILIFLISFNSISFASDVSIFDFPISVGNSIIELDGNNYSIDSVLAPTQFFTDLSEVGSDSYSTEHAPWLYSPVKLIIKSFSDVVVSGDTFSAKGFYTEYNVSPSILPANIHYLPFNTFITLNKPALTSTDSLFINSNLVELPAKIFYVFFSGVFLFLLFIGYMKLKHIKL